MERLRDSGSNGYGSQPSNGYGSQPSPHSSRSGGGWTDVSTMDSAAVRGMVYVMGGFAMGSLLDGAGRQALREKCSERLREEHGVNVQYAEQAVLANLDWGIEGLEKAAKATNLETRAARLEHTEKMLQVAVLLDPERTTAGVPNSYLSAWANFYMALVWKLRNNDRNAAVHLLDMFLLEPGHARRDFAPTLWEQLFRPHMANIEAWYQGELKQIMSASPPLNSNGFFPIPMPARRRSNSQDSATTVSTTQSHSHSKSREFDFEADRNEPGTLQEEKERRPSLTPDQVMRKELLNKLYQDSLDENTQQYAQYYKDWMAYETDSLSSIQGSPVFPRINPPKSSSFSRPQEATATGQIRSSTGRNPGSSSLAGTANGVSGPAAGGGQFFPKQLALLRQSSLDHDLDSFSDASYKDASGYSRNSSIKETCSTRDMHQEALEQEVLEVGDEKAFGHFVDRGGGAYQNPDAKSSKQEEDGEDVEFDKGAGVYLDEEELTEDEILQVSEELSEGRIAVQEANDFIRRLTDVEGQGLDFRKLFEVADAIRAHRRDHSEHRRPVGSHGSPESEVPGSKYSISPRSGIDEEEAEVRSRQSLDTRRSPEALSRMDSQSSLSSLASRNNIFQQKVFSREQSLIRPPKDFVCPITNQLFQDPVTLETGQTYERAAIKEWLDRGNTSCPITRQTLKNQKLPKTNYVLKRLVDNWKDDHPEFFQELNRGEGYPRTSSVRSGRMDGLELEVFEGSQSPGVAIKGTISNDDIQRPSQRFGQKVVPLPSVVMDEVSPAVLEGLLIDLETAVDTLFRTEDLAQCERAVMVAVHAWVDSKCDAAVAASLSKAGVVEGLMEVLSSSKKDEIIRSIVCLLSDLISKDEFTRHTVTRADPDIESIVRILKNPRVPQVAVLLHLLKVPAAQISPLNVVPFLVSILKNNHSFEEGTFSIGMGPKAAAVYLLEQLVTTLDHRTNMSNAEAVVRAEGVPPLMERLEAKALEEKISAVAVLWSCLQSDGGCRMLMVENLKVSTLVDLLHNSREQARTVAIFFLAELIRLKRRWVIEKVLRDVLHEGFLNSMHVLMLHLQMSPMEHRPLVASLLLQLDLLAEPQKHSVYREEAVDALVEALKSEESAKVQLEAAKALACLSGRYSNTGKSSTEASLLKFAGLDDDSKHSVKSDRGHAGATDQEDAEKAAEEWDQRMAMAVLSSGKPLIEALGVALTSKSPKLARFCVVAVAWLTRTLGLKPDISLQSYARNCLLPSLVSLVQTSRDIEGRVLACVSIYNLTEDSVGAQQLTIFCKDLVGPLRQLLRHTWTAKKILETLVASPFTDSNIEMWTHGEVGELDASQSGETRALLYFRGYLYSGHSDASIKIWAVKRRAPRMVQEVREHSRAVLCLTVLEEECKMFSGSADKTVRIWLVEEQRMRCIQVIDLKEAVHCVAVNASFICVIPQGVGIKVLDSGGANPRLLNANKHVQSITVGEEHIYCGCTDNSIQEIDPVNGTSVTIQSGIRSLRGKKAIYSMQLFNNQLYTGGTVVDGIAGKVWRVSNRSLVSSISTQIDVRVMGVSEDLLYLASNLPSGVVEVWLREKNQKVGTFTVGSKIVSLALVGDTIYTGSIDGRLRAWALI